MRLSGGHSREKNRLTPSPIATPSRMVSRVCSSITSPGVTATARSNSSVAMRVRELDFAQQQALARERRQREDGKIGERMISGMAATSLSLNSGS